MATISSFLKGLQWQLFFASELCSSDIPSAFPVVPAIECEMRAGKIKLPEFIVKCPANCTESKEKVYGTGVFASISSICNAAIHRWAPDPAVWSGEGQYCAKAWAALTKLQDDNLIKKKRTQTLHRFLPI